VSYNNGNEESEEEGDREEKEVILFYTIRTSL